jgi:hypothetical protein
LPSMVGGSSGSCSAGSIGDDRVDSVNFFANTQGGTPVVGERKGSAGERVFCGRSVGDPIQTR